MNFKYSKCPKCGRTGELVFNNNPIAGESICFDCIKSTLDYNNLKHADLFCRTYNYPFKPEVWIPAAKEYGDQVFKEYSKMILDDKENQPNLAYTSSTADLWNRTNSEWEKCRSFSEILKKLDNVRESYIDRGRLKWGEQYTFEELMRLDSIYTRTLKANQITNPLQKEAVKTLCKLQIEIDEAVRAKDAKAIKDYSSAWSTFAKQADLENMIESTKTQDITTVAELYDYMERQGFVFKFHDGYDKDEIDAAITDIQNANRKLILESTGLQPLLEEMIKKRQQSQEEKYAQEVENSQQLSELLNFAPEDMEVAVENDEEAQNIVFDSSDENKHTEIVE